MLLKNHYKKSFEIIKENKKIIFIILSLYAASLLSGLIYNYFTYEGFLSIEAKESYYQAIKEINFSENFINNFIKIFTHNIIASLFRIISGILLGIIPLFLIIDGAILDSYSLVASTVDNGLIKSLILFIPHSIFEIPAFILSSSFGLIIFLSLFKKSKRFDNLKNTIIETSLIFLFLILPLLFISGIIESLLIIIYWF